MSLQYAGRRLSKSFQDALFRNKLLFSLLGPVMLQALGGASSALCHQHQHAMVFETKTMQLMRCSGFLKDDAVVQQVFQMAL
jgi:hypothetical protein